jgi:hypothetical protein
MKFILQRFRIVTPETLPSGCLSTLLLISDLKNRFYVPETPRFENALEVKIHTFLDLDYGIYVYTSVFKKMPNFLNSSPTSTEGALRLLSAPSGRF